jgi:hypothetical protein
MTRGGSHRNTVSHFLTAASATVSATRETLDHSGALPMREEFDGEEATVDSHVATAEASHRAVVDHPTSVIAITMTRKGTDEQRHHRLDRPGRRAGVPAPVGSTVR